MLLVVKHPTQPLSFLNESGGTTTGGNWFVPFLLAMILPAYAISSFDATGNASEETKDAARKAPMASVMANVSSYVVGIFMVALIMLAIQDLPAVMESTTPVKLILDTAVGTRVREHLRSRRDRRPVRRPGHAAAHRHSRPVVAGT